MKRDVLRVGVFLVFFFALLYCVSPILAVQSSNGAFTVTPGLVYINWTNGTLNVTSNSNNLTVSIDNEDTQITSNYSQYSRYIIGDYENLNDTSFYVCFNPTTTDFRVQNETGSFTTTSQVLNNTNSTFFYLTPYMFCPPGKYYGYFYIQNKTNATENLTVNVSVQIPISDFNTFNVTTKSGFFKGAMSVNQDYHSYHFNTSLTDNLTYLTVTLTGSSADIDMFLYDGSGKFLAKSINTSSYEELHYAVPATPEMYELRVYGNLSSNYNGYLYFSSLNITNTTGSKTTSLDFGGLKANETSSNHQIVLKNEDDQVLTSVRENKEIYHVDRWLNQSADGTFKLLVPPFAEKVKVRLEWGQDAGENVTNWILYLRDANKVLRGTSLGKYVNANKTTSSNVLEEYVEYTGISAGNDGFWNITVKNASAGSTNLNNYNLTAYIYVPDSWLATNYSTMTFNSSGYTNSSRAVNINLTIPETNVLNGSYEGFLEYYRTNKWKARLPISFSVRTGTLIMNGNLSVTSDKRTHNIGFNTVSSPLSIKIPYNNTGGYPIYIRAENTTNNTLYQIGNDSNYIDFVLSDFPTAPLNPGSSGFLNVSVKINTSHTHNQPGIYRGFVLFNTTNSTNVTRQSSLFKTLNITLYVNLSDKLNVSITSINPSLVHPPTSANNVTFTAQVRLMNGTVISNTSIMSYANFTNIKIFETNVTNYNHTLDTIVSGAPGGGSGCSGGLCYVNATVPANSVGGRFRAYVYVAWNTKMLGGTGEVNLTGVGVNDSLKINDTGVYLTAISPMSFGEVNEGTQNLLFNMTVKNYGALAIPSTSKIRIYLHEGACTSQFTTDVKDSSHSYTRTKNASGVYVEFDMSAFDATGRWIRFEIDVSNISTSNKTCYMTITSTNKKAFNSLENIYMKIVSVEEGGGTSGETPGSESECSSDSDCPSTKYCSGGTCVAVSCPDGVVSNHKCNPYERELAITDYEEKVSVVQGSSVVTEVSVKNKGNVAMDVKLDVTHNISGVTQTVTPSAYNIDPDETYSFTVEFNVNESTKVGNHPVTLKAYVKNNESVSATKAIKLSIEPLEEEKAKINSTFENYKSIFESLKSKFLAIQPGSVSDINLTKANRTYSSLLRMLEKAEEYISSSHYADAADVLDDINESLTTFQAQVDELFSETSGVLFQLGGDIWTWVAIGVVIVVIVVFLVYLLLPPKKGYHPVYGFTKPSAKSRISGRLGIIAEKVKGIGSAVRMPGKREEQTTLTKFEKEKYRYYAEGYTKAQTNLPKKEGIFGRIKKKLGR